MPCRVPLIRRSQGSYFFVLPVPCARSDWGIFELKKIFFGVIKGYGRIVKTSRYPSLRIGLFWTFNSTVFHLVPVTRTVPGTRTGIMTYHSMCEICVVKGEGNNSTLLLHVFLNPLRAGQTTDELSHPSSQEEWSFGTSCPFFSLLRLAQHQRRSKEVFFLEWNVQWRHFKIQHYRHIYLLDQETFVENQERVVKDVFHLVRCPRLT